MIQTVKLLTPYDLITEAYRRFKLAKPKLTYGHGTDNAWDEACSLVLGTLHHSYTISQKKLSSKLSPHQRKILLEHIEKRIKQRIPIPYLTQEAAFAGMSFYVDKRVLIPRSPLGELILRRFKPWLHRMPMRHLLDLCTGSGCIAIACAKMFPHCQVDASDISSDALKVAQINIKKHRVQKRVRLYQGNLYRPLPIKRYDLIISNPPYVTQQEMAHLPKEHRHEPRLALTAGKDGLKMIKQIIKEAPHYLKPNGVLIVEVGSQKAIEHAFPNIPFMWLATGSETVDIFLLHRKNIAV